MFDFDWSMSYYQWPDPRTKKQTMLADIKMLANIKHVDSFFMWFRLWKQLFCHIFIES